MYGLKRNSTGSRKPYLSPRLSCHLARLALGVLPGVQYHPESGSIGWLYEALSEKSTAGVPAGYQ